MDNYFKYDIVKDGKVFSSLPGYWTKKDGIDIPPYTLKDAIDVAKCNAPCSIYLVEEGGKCDFKIVVEQVKEGENVC